MVAPANIVDSKTGHRARVSEFGQLVVAPLQYSAPVEQTLITPGVAVNFISPEQGKKIVVTDIIALADKDVSPTTPADVRIFTADAVDSAIIVSGIVSPQLIRAGQLGLTGLNMIIEEGLWINGTTTDGGVLVTIMFYRVPVDNFNG